MIYSTYMWDLALAMDSASPASCKTPTTPVSSICPNNRPTTNKKNLKNDQLPNDHIVLACPTYRKHRAKRGRLETQA